MLCFGRAGNHVLQDGRRGVLREEIAAYLEGLGLPSALAMGNDGMLVLRAQDLHCWITSFPTPSLGPAGSVNPTAQQTSPDRLAGSTERITGPLAAVGIAN